eukprot:6095843-Prymnesium_polylepis.1
MPSIAIASALSAAAASARAFASSALPSTSPGTASRMSSKSASGDAEAVSTAPVDSGSMTAHRGDNARRSVAAYCSSGGAHTRSAHCRELQTACRQRDRAPSARQSVLVGVGGCIVGLARVAESSRHGGEHRHRLERCRRQRAVHVRCGDGFRCEHTGQVLGLHRVEQPILQNASGVNHAIQLHTAPCYRGEEREDLGAVADITGEKADGGRRPNRRKGPLHLLAGAGDSAGA